MTFLPYRRSHLFVLGLLLVDLPAIVAVTVVGHQRGYIATYEDVSAWRLAHPLSLVPSLMLAVWLVVRWKRA
jgi:hypothetical protein